MAGFSGDRVTPRFASRYLSLSFTELFMNPAPWKISRPVQKGTIASVAIVARGKIGSLLISQKQGTVLQNKGTKNLSPEDLFVRRAIDQADHITGQTHAHVGVQPRVPGVKTSWQ